MADNHAAITVTLPARLADAVLKAAEASGQRAGPTAIAMEHFVILSERSFERLLNGSRTALEEASRGWQKTGTAWALASDCGGEGLTAGAGAAPSVPAPLSGADEPPA